MSVPAVIRRALPAALALGVLLLPAASALAVDEGVPDGARHPNVGALAFDPDGPGEATANTVCTGSLLSDTVFLTAAHCISTFPDVQWVVTLAAGTPAAPMTRPGIIFDEFPLPLLVPAVRPHEVLVHPRFDPDTRRHDVALLLFAPGTFAGIAPVKLPETRSLDRVAHRGDLFRLVGYGTDPEWGDGEPRYIFEGYRQTARAPFQALTRTHLLLDGDPRRTGHGGLCYGDSGGPQFLGETDVAVSLLSHAGDTCREGIQGQRLDTRAVRRFLSRHVDVP